MVTPHSFVNVLFSFELGTLLLDAGLFLALLHEERQHVMQQTTMVQLLWQQQVDRLSSVDRPH